MATALAWAVAQEGAGAAPDFAGQGVASSQVVPDGEQASGDLYSELHWDDGQGASLIGITVRHDYVTTCELSAGPDCRERTLADGSRVTTYTERTPVTGGVGTRRVVDLLRAADDVRVVVTSTNGD